MNLKEIETDEKQIAGLAVGAGAAGWSAFVAIYRPAMVDYVEGYLKRRRITWLDEEEIVQNVLVKLVKRIAHFHYDRKQGRFRDLLGKMLLAAAVDAVRKDVSSKRVKKEYADAERTAKDEASELDAWHDALFGMALRKVLADTSINKQTRDVFKRYVIEGEEAKRVADAFDINVNVVYQIKNRLTAKLKEEILTIEKATPFAH